MNEERKKKGFIGWIEDTFTEVETSAEPGVPMESMTAASKMQPLVTQVPGETVALVETDSAKEIIQKSYEGMTADKNIFKIAEIRDSVKDLPEEQQRTVILGFLKPMGFSIEEFLMDGGQRANHLGSFLKAFVQNATEQIAENEKMIASLLQQVDSLKALNLEIGKNKEETQKYVIAEYQRIQEILKFMKAEGN
ncbi:MAG: hypothetical protein RR533_09960 [Carnobacterium sp.]